MPLPNDELQARYEGIRRDLVPAVKEFLDTTDSKETGRQAYALKKFIIEEADLPELASVGTFDPWFTFSSGIDIGVVLGGRIADREQQDNLICPECKVAVVDLIAAARKLVANKRRPVGYPDTSDFEAAIAILDKTHDDVDVEGGA